MIFVTVGTHEQGFTRLIKAVDQLVEKKMITETVMMQTGYTEYEPKYCNFSKFLSYDKMMSFEDQADIVITHGGPSTFMSVISRGKIPIVVPRQHQFHEHVNDHQVIFTAEVAKKGYPIIIVKDIRKLHDAILEARHSVSVDSHNHEFVQSFSDIVNSLVKTSR